jgi:hypothetical protein
MLALTDEVEKAINHGLQDDKKTPLKTVAARVKTFLLGYFNVSKLADLPPNDSPAAEIMYGHAFEDLASCVKHDANVLQSAPDDAGRRMAAETLRMGTMVNAELKWDAECVGLAFKFARLRGLGASDLMTFLQNIKLVAIQDGGHMKSQGPLDVSAGLRLCVASRNGGKFCREAIDHKLSIHQSLQEMEKRRFNGKPLETVPAKDVDAAIEWALEAIKEEAKAKASAPVQPVATVVETGAQLVEEEDDLFNALP